MQSVAAIRYLHVCQGTWVHLQDTAECLRVCCSLLFLSAYRWAYCSIIMARCYLQCSWQCGVSSVWLHDIIFQYSDLCLNVMWFFLQLLNHVQSSIFRSNFFCLYSTTCTLSPLSASFIFIFIFSLYNCLDVFFTETCTAKEKPHQRKNLLVLATLILFSLGHLAMGVVKQSSKEHINALSPPLFSF